MRRRAFLQAAAGAAIVGLGGCASMRDRGAVRAAPTRRRPPRVRVLDREDSWPPPQVMAMYGPRPEERFPLPRVPIESVPPNFWRQRVPYQTRLKPGTLIVDTNTFYLHLIEENGTAMRYGVGLGRAGFGWQGVGDIQWKRPWPTWTPPDEMIAREPHLERWSVRNGGMPPGLLNPLGARALYIFENGVDTLYRVHGTPDYFSIGKAVSSGCVRLINQDVIDLYRRTPTGAQLIVA